MLQGAQPLLLVGAGKMGGAMLERWLASGLAASEVTILDPYLEGDRWAALAKAGTATATRVTEAADRAYKVMVLAVKPQSMAEALTQVRALAAPDTTIVSIAAGVRLATLEAAFPAGQAIVRAMPNTPAQVGMSMTVAVPNANVTLTERAIVEQLLATIGALAWIDDEALIDAVTAVSGSGPAYLFLLAECLAEAARRVGLPDDLAALLARQTVAGSGALLAASPLSPAVLRQNVTSPGGTTAAALSVLMAEDGLQPLLTRAVEAAKQRSIDLAEPATLRHP
jgi:pyrroline-5-carboxylate reductase